jgi:hypothetical protein
VAVARFLDGSLDFSGIPRLLEARSTGSARPAPPIPTSTSSWPRPRGPREPRLRTGREPRLMDGIVFGAVAILLFIVVLGGIVLIHELGHYLTARALNVRSSSSASAFRRARRSCGSKGETLWTLNWLPDRRVRPARGRGRRRRGRPEVVRRAAARSTLAILVAGVGMNIALGLRDLLPHRAARHAGARRQDRDGRGGSPRRIAGLVPGDEIYAVNGEQFDLFGGQTCRTRCARTRARPSLGPARGRREAATRRPCARPRSSTDRGALGVGSSSRPTRYAATTWHVASDRRGRAAALGRPDPGGLGELVEGSSRTRRRRRRLRARSASPSRSPTSS